MYYMDINSADFTRTVESELRLFMADAYRTVQTGAI
jgi:hypothetical protein